MKNEPNIYTQSITGKLFANLLANRTIAGFDTDDLTAENIRGVIDDEGLFSMGTPREDILENQNKLASCNVPHSFTIDTTPDKEYGKRWQCNKCGGIIGSVNRRWYLLGLKHAKKSS